jgi:hypothetical protein
VKLRASCPARPASYSTAIAAKFSAKLRLSKLALPTAAIRSSTTSNLACGMDGPYS